MFGFMSSFLANQNKRLRNEVELQNSIIESMDSTIELQAELISQLEKKIEYLRIWQGGHITTT